MSLKERRDLSQLYERGGAAGGVLFSLVEVRGSSYRRAGARMLVNAAGVSAGTLSGGCLEADLLRRAGWYVREGARVETFSTAFDDTSEIPYGLGCGGEVDLLAEPAASAEAAAMMEAMDATLQGAERTVVTVLPRSGAPLARFVMDPAGDVLFASEHLETEDLVPLRRAALRSGHAEVVEVAAARIFVEKLLPVQRLVIFGGGQDARPLSQMAVALGWRVLVVDTRVQRAESFPGADVLQASHAAAAGVTAEDAVMVMTHSYEQDRHLVAEMLPQPPRFLGLLGARHRSALLLAEAAAMAGTPLAAAVHAVHAPVGLELGGDGPEAIALAVVAQIQHVLNGTTADAVPHRRMTLEDVERVLEDGPVRPASEACAMYAAPSATEAAVAR